jgi:hypothetical protein
VHDPHRVTGVQDVGGPLQPGVAQGQLPAAHPFEPEVGVLGAERPGPGQGGVGQRAQRQRQECLVDGWGHSAS